jgi:hypothetical protein
MLRTIWHASARGAALGENDSKRVYLRLCLASILLIQIAGLAWFLPQDVLLAHRVTSALRPSQPATWIPARNALRSLGPEPSIGSPLPRDPAGTALRRIAGSPGRGAIVVYLGNGTCCIHADLAAWEQQARKRGLTVLFLSSAAPTDWSQQTAFVRRQLRLRSPLVFDPEGRLVRHLNAYYTPRAYLFSSIWRLRWSQPADAPYLDLFADRGFRASLEDQNR